MSRGRIRTRRSAICLWYCGPNLLGGTPQFAPAPPLLVPVQCCRHGQHAPQYQRRPTAGGRFEEQQLFLQIRSKIEQAEYLAHSRPADMAQPGRRSVAAERARANQLFDMPGQRHKPRDPRDAARACLWRLRCPGRVKLLRASALAEWKGASDDGGRIHALSFRKEEGVFKVMAISP